MKIKFLLGRIFLVLTILSLPLSFFFNFLDWYIAFLTALYFFICSSLIIFIWIWLASSFKKGEENIIKRIRESLKYFPANGLTCIGFFFLFASFFFSYDVFVNDYTFPLSKSAIISILYIGFFLFSVLIFWATSLNGNSIKDLSKKEVSPKRKVAIFLSSLFSIIILITVVFIIIKFNQISNKNQDPVTSIVYVPQIEIVHDGCPSGYVMVQKNSGNEYFFNKEDSALFSKDYFCVMAYEAKCDINGDNIGDYPNELKLLRGQSFNWNDCITNSVVSSPDGAPIVNITQEESKNVCASLGEGYHLITNDEWMAIARDVEGVNQNWEESTLFRGNSNKRYVASGFDGAYNGINSRYFYLKNGNIVWDMAGNVWEWIGDTIEQKDQPPYSGWHEINSLSDYGLLGKENISSVNKNLSSINGIGQLFLTFSSEESETKAMLRGGSWGDLYRSGIYTLDFLNSPNDAHEYMGFRCAKIL